MTTQEYEEYLQKEVDEFINIRRNPNADDIAGVYWKDAYVGVSVAPEEIREEFDKNYTDALGNPYRTIKQTTELVKAKLPRVQDPETYKMMTE